MSSSPELERLTTRPFSFFPAILNIPHNEWLFRRATWSEALVVNCKSGEEIWIPQRFLGGVSGTDPVVIVGLKLELEYKGGAVWPYQRRVIEMPLAVGGGPVTPAESEPASHAPQLPERRQTSTEGGIFRLVAGAVALSILFYLAMVNLTRVGHIKPRVVVGGRDQTYLDLNARDDYTAIVRKLGTPDSDHWMEPSGEIQYRALAYPRRKYTVILMGSLRSTAAYVGTLDERWMPLHSVDLPSGGTTASLLRNLRQF